MTYMGVDIGGTKIYSVRYDADFTVLADDRRPTGAAEGCEQVLTHLVASIQSVWDCDTQGIGVAWAGFVDHKRGVIKHAPNIPGCAGFGLTDFLTAQFGVPVFLENDAQLFAYAEALQTKGKKKMEKVVGANQCVCPETQMVDTKKMLSPVGIEALGSDPKDFVSLGIIIGTGVGAGLVINGEIYQGAQGMAAEVGHMIVQGQEVEAQIAGTAMQIFWQQTFGYHDFEREAHDLQVMTADFKQKFTPKIQVFSTWLANLILAYNPHEVVFGGTTAQKIWSYFSTDIEEQTRQLLKQYPFEFRVRFSKLQNAGVLGAAMLIREKLR